MEYLGLILGLCGFVFVISGIVIFNLLAIGQNIYLTPKGLHNRFKLTWIGTILAFIIVNVTCIYMWIFNLIYIIFKGHLPQFVK